MNTEKEMTPEEKKEVIRIEENTRLYKKFTSGNELFVTLRVFCVLGMIAGVFLAISGIVDDEPVLIGYGLGAVVVLLFQCWLFGFGKTICDYFKHMLRKEGLKLNN